MGKKKSISEKNLTSSFPLVVLKDAVVVPMIPQPVKVEDSALAELLIREYENRKEVFVTWEKPVEHDKEKYQIGNYGIICRIDKVLHMPGAPALVFFNPGSRGLLFDIEEGERPQRAEVFPTAPILPPSRKSKENNLLLERSESLFQSLMSYLMDPEKQNAENLVKEFSFDPIEKLYAMANVAPLSLEERYEIVECNNFKELLMTIIRIFDQADQRMALQMAVHEKTHREISKQQKEAFLRLHLKHVKEELGEADDENDDIMELTDRSLNMKWSEQDQENFDKELAKLSRLNINNPEYSVQYSYLDQYLSLPWQNYSHKNISLKKVEEILDRDHYGLEKVKERIIEQMAVLKLRNDLKAPIICLYGPPGIGKTSIGKSVAEALGREYARISLGGVHDEAEIRGHRRTYIGAMPGRFIQALTKIKTGNPLMLLDEIDKLGKDFKGDPSSALLEALDPEQNNTFHDNFIDHPYDLSKVLFIATANDVSTIPAPLRDRMEIIEMSGYIPAEKQQIALRHLVGKVAEANGFPKDEIGFTPEAIDNIVIYYTREAGVRQLEKKIGKIFRKIARLKAGKKKYPKLITPEIAETFLGKHEVNPDSYEGNEGVGIATGLAWTPVGGDVLFIETSLSPGKGEKLTLTGNLGDVMKESATIALQYLKANATQIGIDPESFTKYDIHIHVPEGAVPKDGPSAGITIASSMASAFLNKAPESRTAMTGEITLRGKVLPVGGVKEKILAARQAGIKRIILSEENRKDIEEIAPQYLKGLEFLYVKNVMEVFKYLSL